MECQKGRYEEGRHAFEILAGLDPVKVERSSAHAGLLLDALRAQLAGGRRRNLTVAAAGR